MGSGRENHREIDPLTAWERAAVKVLMSPAGDEGIDTNASRENMLKLMKALDRGDIDSVLSDAEFMKKTERLLLALLGGERIEVAQASIYAARKEIFAAAQVIYNHAVLRHFWVIHPKIEDSMDEGE